MQIPGPCPRHTGSGNKELPLLTNLLSKYCKHVETMLYSFLMFSKIKVYSNSMWYI